MKAPSLALTALCFLLTPHSRVFAQRATASENKSSQEAQLASVAGQVLRAATGEPLKKSRILLRNADDDSADPYIAITNSEGRFLIAAIHPGRYSMRVAREGFISKSYDESETGDNSSVLTLKPGQQLNDLIFRLQKCAVISGRVLDEDGEPARFVSVEAIARSTHRGKISTQLVASVATNDLGEYRLFDLNPGSYFISASVGQRSWTTIGKVNIDNSILNPAGGYIRTYYPSVPEIQRASAVEVKGGDEMSSVDIILLRQRSYKVCGQVLNAAVDHPASDIRVEILPQGLESYSLADVRQSEANRKTGEFELDDIPPGSYKIAAAYRDGENEFLGVTQVDVMDADVNAVRITITRGADLYGRVIKEGKISPSSAIRISASNRDRETPGGSDRGEAKPDGTFIITGLPDGVFDISAFSPECPTCFVKSATAAGADILDSGLTVSSGSAPSPIQLVLSSRSGTVAGTVKNDDGLPVSGATIVLVSDHPRHDENQDLYRIATADQAGYFVTVGIAPGKYHAFAWKNVDYQDYEDPDFRAAFLPKAQAFSVSEDEKKTLQLTLLPAPADAQ
jgi:protocatechuate 3,4-dioxygenase beta subunit